MIPLHFCNDCLSIYGNTIMRIVYWTTHNPEARAKMMAELKLCDSCRIMVEAALERHRLANSEEMR